MEALVAKYSPTTKKTKEGTSFWCDILPSRFRPASCERAPSPASSSTQIASGPADLALARLLPRRGSGHPARTSPASSLGALLAPAIGTTSPLPQSAASGLSVYPRALRPSVARTARGVRAVAIRSPTESGAPDAWPAAGEGRPCMLGTPAFSLSHTSAADVPLPVPAGIHRFVFHDAGCPTLPLFQELMVAPRSIRRHDALIRWR